MFELLHVTISFTKTVFLLLNFTLWGKN